MTPWEAPMHYIPSTKALQMLHLAFQPYGEPQQDTATIGYWRRHLPTRKKNTHTPSSKYKPFYYTGHTPKKHERSARGEVLGGPSGNPLEVGHHVLKGARPVFEAATQRHREASDGALVFLDVVGKAQGGVVLLDMFSYLPWRRFNHVAKKKKKKGTF